MLLSSDGVGVEMLLSSLAGSGASPSGFTSGEVSGLKATSPVEGGLEVDPAPSLLGVSATSVIVIVTVSDTDVVPSLTSTVSV
jgi:hypothetical protein